MGLENTRDALRDIFLCVFSLFPAAHLLAFVGWLDPLIEERAYCVGDMLMKVLILGNVAVESVFETREESLLRIKEEQKNRMLEQLKTAVSWFSLVAWLLFCFAFFFSLLFRCSLFPPREEW